MVCVIRGVEQLGFLPRAARRDMAHSAALAGIHAAGDPAISVLCVSVFTSVDIC